MQVPSTSIVNQVASPTNFLAAVSVLGGDTASLPVGQLLSVMVLSSASGRATLDASGQKFLTESTNGMKAGDRFQARVRSGTPLVLELISKVPTSSPNTNAKIADPNVSVVDVLASRPDGLWSVRIDGKETLARLPDSIVAGQRYVLQVNRTSNGIELVIPEPWADMPVQVATAILRSHPRSDIGQVATALSAETQAASARTAIPKPVQEATGVVYEILSNLAPRDRPPASQELRQLVTDGGLLFEAKLGRAAAQEASLPAGDLKGALLQLLQTAHELGQAPMFKAAEGAIQAIESAQASNVLSQDKGTQIFLQIPLYDTGHWKTVSLAIERETPSNDDVKGSRSNFRVFMHVPLSQLGETWIDAGLSGGTFRATLYIDSAASRARIGEELASLRADLAESGMREAVLEVRQPNQIPHRFRQLGAEMLAGHPASVSLLDERV